MAEGDDQEGKKQALPKLNWEKLQRERFTYKWQFYSKEHDCYFKFADDHLFEKGSIMEGEERTEPIEIELYKIPKTPPFDFHIKDANRQLALRVEFFKEVFDERAFVEGYQPQHKFQRIVIPEAIHHEILNVINDFGLLPIRDLILEIIASAQDIYIRDVAFWERPENKKLITSAEKETENAIKVIEQSGVDMKSRQQFDGPFRPNLDHIKFVFNTGTIKLDHKWLAIEFIEHMMLYYDDLNYKNWKKELARYPDRFKETIRKSKFKFRLAKSYYNLFTKTEFFKLPEGVRYPNKLMRCIAKLIEFSLIPVGNWADPEEYKENLVRNWLDRNEFEPKLNYAEVPADIEKLKQYFEPNFLEMANSTKRADAISTAFFVCHRFDIPDLLPDLIHIASCIIEINWLVGHQMTSKKGMNEPEIPEMDSFRKLMNGVEGKQKLSSLKFTIEGEDGEHELSSRLPMFLIEKALREYYSRYRIEFDCDVVPTTYQKREDDSITIDYQPKINLPHKRHLVRLVHSLYNYLKERSDIDKRDFLPGQQYYEIIAILFKETSVFYRKDVDERAVVEQIKEWHHLTLES